MSADSRLSDLLVLWEELRDQGRSVSIEELCRDCPELAEELRRRVQALEALDPLMRLVPTLPEDVATRPGESQSDSAATAHEKAGPSTAEIPIPEVPGYEVLRELGRGGMGIVYEARQIALGRRVALKMILLGPRAGSAQRRRFRTEAETVALVQHPNIVQIYEVGEVGEQPYCALELVDGGSLADKIDGRPQSPRTAAQLVATLAQAVQVAHACGIIHRDLKPGNVLLTRDGTPKIADFGLAKKVESTAGLTATGSVLGTPNYMAPEQAMGSKDVGPSADIHALGGILYELLTGRPPFLAATLYETLEQVRQQEAQPPSYFCPDIPRDLEAICLKCLRKDPLARYACAQALADDLWHFLKGEPVEARAVSRCERALKWAQRKPTAAALLAVSTIGVLTLLGMGLVYNIQLRQQRDIAHEQRLKAQQSEAKAQEEKKVADELRKEAETYFRLAREVVDEYATTLNEDEHIPADELRQQLLQSTLEYYRELARHNKGSDPALRRAQGRAYLHLARLNGQLGKRESDAIAQYQKAGDLFEGLSREDPDNVEYQQDLALLRYYQGRAHRDLGQLRQAREFLTQARAVQERLAQRQPRCADCQRNLADIWLALGEVEFDQPGGPDSAEVSYEKALGVMQALQKQQPPRAADEDTVGDVYFHLAQVYLARGQLESARAANEKALAIAKKLTHDHRATINYRSDLARDYGNLGSILYAQHQSKKAWDAQQEALQIRSRLVEEHGNQTQLVVDLGKSFCALGQQSDTPAAAVDWYSQAVDKLEEIRTREPNDFEARNALAAAYLGRSQAYDRLGRHSDARADQKKAEAIQGSLSIQGRPFRKPQVGSPGHAS